MTDIERAVGLYRKAKLVEKMGGIERADALYLKSADIFMQAVEVHVVDAANAMNAWIPSPK